MLCNSAASIGAVCVSMALSALCHLKHLILQVLICECFIVAEYRTGSKLLCGGGSKKPATDSRPREIFWTRQDWLDGLVLVYVGLLMLVSLL